MVTYDFPPHGHLLLELLPSCESVGKPLPRIVSDPEELEASTIGFLRGTMPVTLDEPNVLVLDLPEWRPADEEAWRPREEILRVDNQIRDLFKLPRRGGAIVQPWAQTVSGDLLGRVELRFTVEAACDIAAPELAFEPPEEPFEIEWDGRRVEFCDNGFWTDECVRKTPFPAIEAGKHELIFRCGYSARSGLERFYLLGDFGVGIRGDEAILTAPVRELHWGDIGPQGLPFYGGNVTYHATFDLPESGRCRLRIPGRNSIHGELCGNLVSREVPFAGFFGTLIGVAVDGREAGAIAFAPFECPFGELSAGRHTVDLTLYGHRANSFGVIHPRLPDSVDRSPGVADTGRSVQLRISAPAARNHNGAAHSPRLLTPEFFLRGIGEFFPAKVPRLRFFHKNVKKNRQNQENKFEFFRHCTIPYRSKGYRDICLDGKTIKKGVR
ncbi:MAG: hypothetical protein L6W00_09000 [Lentisphaeria bacterium]|nr:MAG: hypothetical protein L6W00_09000 [Lentisphaeria bacterium]